jgi:hypothetical protein
MDKNYFFSILVINFFKASEQTHHFNYLLSLLYLNNKFFFFFLPFSFFFFFFKKIWFNNVSQSHMIYHFRKCAIILILENVSSSHEMMTHNWRTTFGDKNLESRAFSIIISKHLCLNAEKT